MGKNPRVLIGLGLVAVLGIAIMLVGENKSIGAVVTILAIGGAVLFLRSGAGTGDDDFFEAPDERPARSSRSAAASTATVEPLEEYEADFEEAEESEGLPSWGGAEPLTAWTPPEDLEEEEEERYEEEEDATLSAFEELDFGAEDEFATLDEEFEELVEEAEPEPLPTFDLEVEPLPTFDLEAEPLPTYEPEPVAEKPKGFSFGNNSLIKEIEDVHSDDDIMKSSAATELALSADKGENSELARLLAKVQSRLAAYD